MLVDKDRGGEQLARLIIGENAGDCPLKTFRCLTCMRVKVFDHIEVWQSADVTAFLGHCY